MAAAVAGGVAASDAGAQAAPGPSAAGAAADAPRVTVAIVPRETEPEDLASVEGLSLGLMSAGLATVVPTQTFLDISAGNRVFTSLYPDDVPYVVTAEPEVLGWDQIVERAEGAPANIVPGLLGQTLNDAGIPTRADPLLITPALIAVNEEGEIPRTKADECVTRGCPGLSVVPAEVADLQPMVDRLEGDDMLIVIERPPPPIRDSLAIGVAGEGFDGNLTSDTTRTAGFVIATDIAPTILERYGLEVPDDMSGRAIRSEGEDDVEAISARGERMRVVSSRRGTVITNNIITWFLIAVALALVTRGRAGRVAFGILGLAIVLVPAFLLLGAEVQTSRAGERLLVGLGAPAAAAALFFLVRGWASLAVATAITVCAYALDVMTGSNLVAQSLLGPNPGLGVRFFGIGNELESILSVMIPVGVGAGLTAWGERSGAPPSRKAAVIAFFAVAALFAAIFASGRFGADVGAAIVFPAGAAMAALAVPGVLKQRKLLLLVVGAPVAGLILLALIDLVAGGDAHLSRSVLSAGGGSELGDVAERRLRLSASSFNRAVDQQLFWITVAAAAIALWQRKRIGRWLADVPLARAGMAGAAGSVLLGVVANDSGATFFTIGTIGLLGILAFAYSRYASVP